MTTTTASDTSAILTPQLLKSTGLSNFTQDQINRAVYVTNLSAKATLKNVSDFFSFCGDIERMIMDRHPDHDGNQFCVVVFDSESAYSTALLLGNAVIADQPIAVAPYSTVAPRSEIPSRAATTASSSSSSSGAADGHRTASSVIASLVANGFITGETVVGEMRQQARILDSQTNMSNRLKMAYSISAAKAREVDESLQLSNTLNTLTSNVKQTLDDFEDRFKIRAQTEAAAKTVRETTYKTASDISQKALEIEPIKQGWDWLSSGWSSLTSTVTGIQKETEQEIARRRGETIGTESRSSESDGDREADPQSPVSASGSSDVRSDVSHEPIYPSVESERPQDPSETDLLQSNNESDILNLG